MKQTKPIYVVVLIKLEGNKKDPLNVSYNTRAVGWFPEFKDADVNILNNSGDIAEGEFFDYIVLEKTPPGHYAHHGYGIERAWYERDHKQKKWKRLTKRPQIVTDSKVMGFGIG